MQRLVHFDIVKKELHLLVLVKRNNPAVEFLEQIFDFGKSSEGLGILEAVSKQRGCQSIIVQIWMEIVSVITRSQPKPKKAEITLLLCTTSGKCR